VNAPVSAGCWADPLSRAERRELAGKLARACHLSHAASIEVTAREGECELARSLVEVSMDCSSVHLDVTERAEVTR
jgi:hypothetical protein